MKLAVIADIHGNSVALERVLEDARAQSVQASLILGDLVMMGPDPGGVLEVMRDLRPAYWIKGNTDMWFEEIAAGWKPGTIMEEAISAWFCFADERLNKSDVEFIVSLPTERSISHAGLSIRCVHGSPGSINKGMDHRTTADQLERMVGGIHEEIVVCGHTHVPFIGQACGKRILNAGSVGRPFDGDSRASYGIIDVTSGSPTFEIRRVDYSIDRVVEMARKAGFPNVADYERSLRNASF